MPSNSNAEIILRWRIHTGVCNPAKLLICWFTLLIVFMSGCVLLRSVLGGLVGAILLLFALKDFMLPMTYTLTGKTARSSLFGLVCEEIDWIDVRSIYRMNGAIKLSPNENPLTSSSEERRGVILVYSESLREQLEQTVQDLSGKPIQTFTKLGAK